MNHLTPFQLNVLEALCSKLDNGGHWLDDDEILALQVSLPRMIALERTVTEAHLDAARETPREFLPPFTYTAEDLSWWQRISRWWQRQKDEFNAGYDRE